MRTKPFLFFVSFLLLLLCSNCDKESFSFSSTDKLIFSVDTLSFDTVLTGQPSADLVFKVYNRNKKALKISSITLANYQQTGFVMNVDGMSTTELTDWEINGKDSLFVRVRIFPKVVGATLPVLLKDSIVFVVNGNSQDVKLRAMGQDVVRLKKQTLKKDVVFSDKRPYLISDTLLVEKGVTLTLLEGTRLLFHSKAHLVCRGQLIAKGSRENPIYFTGDRLDKLFPDLPYQYLSGQWGGVTFEKDSYENEFENVRIQGGRYGVKIDSTSSERLKLKMTNSIIHNVRGVALSAVNAFIVCANSQISNAMGAVVFLKGGRYTFTHCTIANYYNWDIREAPALIVSNFTRTSQEKMIYYPIKETTFNNCIVYGSRLPELLLDNKWDKQPVATLFDCVFNNCLIRSREQISNSFKTIIWDEDPKFVNVGKGYNYDFHLGDLSSAIGKANLLYTNKYLFDLDGRDRMLDGKADLGAYEYFEEEKN